MKKLKMLYRSVKLMLAYRLIARGNRIIGSVAAALGKDGFGKEAFILLASHHNLVASTHRQLYDEMVRPLVEKEADKPKVYMHEGVEVTDWTHTPRSQRVARDGIAAWGSERNN